MKVGLKAYFELDTDPDGDNKKDSSSVFSPENLMVILPFIDRIFRSKYPQEATDKARKVEFGEKIPDGHTGTADCPECAKGAAEPFGQPESPPL
jgi:hypothetical protein